MTRRSGRRGFTLIEVMVAVGIVTMGAVGILALQKAALRGNIESREVTTATQITRTWVERLRRDALMWNSNVPGGAPASQYVRLLPAGAGSTGWISPVSNVAGESAAFTWQGQDTLVLNDTRYCVNVRLTWLQLNQTARAEVRTYWWRQSLDPNTVVFQGCGNPENVTATLGNVGGGLRAVHAATIIRWQPLQPTL